MPFPIQIIVGLLCLSFLVFIHELGHFLVAKKVGVGVKTFSIGFGKKLLKYHHKGTDYCISAIPFGGYVAMNGEAPGSSKNKDDDTAFANKSIRARAAIALGGPVVNIVFAFLILIPVFMIGYQEKVSEPLFVGDIEKGSAAEIAGLKLGDEITHVEGEPIKNFEAFVEEVAMSLDKELEFKVVRDNSPKVLTVVPQELSDMGIGHIGIRSLTYAIVRAEPEKGTPAHAAGFLKGDTLVKANGMEIFQSTDVVREVTKAKETPMEIIVARASGHDTLTVTPAYNENYKRYLVGIVFGEAPPIVKRNFTDALARSWEESIYFAKAPFKYLKKIFTGGAKIKSMSGPVGIVQVIGVQADASFTKLLWLIGFISMNLGIMNLLPLAVTDGGILVFLGIEAVRGRPLPARIVHKIQTVFFALFITLFIYITFQDALRFKLFL
jgi:regulator of sigma E protease